MNFLGSTTPFALIGDVSSGVQQTGSGLYPLFLFLGIALAFAVALYVIELIKGMFSRNGDSLAENNDEYLVRSYSLKDREKIRDLAGENDISLEKAESIYRNRNRYL